MAPRAETNEPTAGGFRGSAPEPVLALNATVICACHGTSSHSLSTSAPPPRVRRHPGEFAWSWANHR